MNETPELSRLVLIWGPGLLFMVGFGWIAYKLGDKLITAQLQSRHQQFEMIQQMAAQFIERFITANDAQAAAVSRLATAVEQGLNEQRDVGVALRALALKIDELHRKLEVMSAK